LQDTLVSPALCHSEAIRVFPIEKLYRYPVKGLSAEPLDTVTLSAGQGVPLDRQYAITNGKWEFQAERYQPRPKTDFLVLVKHEQLAEYRTCLDDASQVFKVQGRDGQTHSFDLCSEPERQALCGLLARRLGLAGNPQLVEAAGIRFTDVSVMSAAMMNAISLVNLASVEALQADLGKAVDPLRFRANIHLRTVTPWEELQWVGREVQIGAARGKVVLRTRRCAATNVDPLTAARDLSIPQALVKHYGHADMGIYIEVIEGGPVAIGDAVQLLG
jgi:uncharacterized protein YcbX